MATIVFQAFAGLGSRVVALFVTSPPPSGDTRVDTSANRRVTTAGDVRVTA